MHSFSLSHSRSINIFRNALSEGGTSSISESHETVDRPSNEEIFQGEFLKLLESEDFTDRLKKAIKAIPDATKRGEATNTYLRLAATGNKMEYRYNEEVKKIHERAQRDRHALMEELKPSQDSISA